MSNDKTSNGNTIENFFTDDNGRVWVDFEHFNRIQSIAVESKLIIESIQKLLGVFTTTEALSRIVDLQNIEKENFREMPDEDPPGLERYTQDQ